MAALTTERDTPMQGGDAVIRKVSLKMAAQKIWRGSLVMLDAGYAKRGAVATGKIAVGRAAATVDNSGGAAGDLSIEVEQGVFKFANSTSSDAITQAEVGSNCYIVDDQTVAKTDGTGTRSVAGKVVAVDSDGVWVAIRAF
jgi:hypothetical protein